MPSNKLRNVISLAVGARNSLIQNRYKIAGILLFSLYLLIIVSTTVIMVHNSPLNTITSQSDDDAFADAHLILQEENKRPGLTFGEVDRPVKDQVRTVTGYLIFSNRFVSLVALLTIALLGLFCIGVYFQSFILAVLSSVFCYMGGILVIFELTPQIYFITSNWSTESVLWAASNDRIVTGFFLLTFFQSIIVTSVPLLWTRSIMPEFHSHQALRIHLNNWRKYGSWLATVLGGVLLTSVLVFINDNSPFGSLFIQHSLILIGGAVVLNLGFVVFKLQCIEKKIVNS